MSNLRVDHILHLLRPMTRVPNPFRISHLLEMSGGWSSSRGTGPSLLFQVISIRNDLLHGPSISWQLQHLSWMARASLSFAPDPSRLCPRLKRVDTHTHWFCEAKSGSPTKQTGMLTANTNMAKQMVHAYLFRFPFQCTWPL